MSKIPSASLWALVLSLCLVAAMAQASDGYYSDMTEGYYWYRDPKQEQPEKPQKKQPANRPQKRNIPKMSDYTYEQLWNMHPDDFTKLQEDFHKKAVMTLKPEDAKDYKTLQDIARRKAVAYMNVDQVVTQSNPELSLENDIPYMPKGRMAEKRKDIQDMDNFLFSRRGGYGLIVFNSRGCPYCEEQQGILNGFSQLYGWDVKNVDIADQPAAASMFNVEMTPSIILIKRGKSDYFPISSGLIALNQLKERVYGGVKNLTGEQTIQQYGVREYQKGGGLDPTAPLERRKRGRRAR